MGFLYKRSDYSFAILTALLFLKKTYNQCVVGFLVGGSANHTTNLIKKYNYKSIWSVLRFMKLNFYSFTVRPFQLIRFCILLLRYSFISDFAKYSKTIIYNIAIYSIPARGSRIIIIFPGAK